MCEPTKEAEIEAALAAYMAGEKIDRDEALRRILRDWLIGHGYLPLPEPGPQGINIIDKG